MGAAAAVMGVVQGALSLNQADQQAKSYRAQADYQKSMNEVNSMFASMKASDAMDRGEKQAASIGKQARQVIGAQRAGLAAQGVELDSGSALDVQQETAGLSRIDQINVRNNAWREAMGYKIDAMNSNTAASMAQISGKAQASASLLTGGIQAANQVYSGYSAYKGRG